MTPQIGSRPNIVSWSFSRLSDFEQCPLKFKLKYLDKLQEVTNEAAERGTNIHEAMEAYLRSETTDYPCSYFQTDMDEIKQFNPIVEEKWGFDLDWNPCAWETAWLRIIPDFYYIHNDILYIHDFKTGKPNTIKHTAQGQLYAIGGWHKFHKPIAKTIFWYLDSGKTHTSTIKDFQIPLIQKTWTNRATLISHQLSWRPKPSKWGCTYCGVQEHCSFRYES